MKNYILRFYIFTFVSSLLLALPLLPMQMAQASDETVESEQQGRSSGPDSDIFSLKFDKNPALAQFLYTVLFAPANLTPVPVGYIEILIHELEKLEGEDKITREDFLNQRNIKKRSLEKAYDVIKWSASSYNVPDTVDIFLRQIRSIIRLSSNYFWRILYSEVYSNVVSRMMFEVFLRGADPLKLKEAKPQRVQGWDQEGKPVFYDIYVFEGKDPENKIAVNLAVPNSDHLRSFRPSALARSLGRAAGTAGKIGVGSVVTSFKHLPVSSAEFYTASLVVSGVFQQFSDPLSNPHAFQDAVTQLSIPWVADFYAFSVGSSITSNTLNHFMIKNHVGYKQLMLISKYIGQYLGMAGGSLLSGLLRDLGTTFVNCAKYAFDPKAADQADYAETLQACDFAFERWNHDNMAAKFFGHATQAVAAAAAAAGFSYVVKPPVEIMKNIGASIPSAMKGSIKFMSSPIKTGKLFIEGFDLKSFYSGMQALFSVASAVPASPQLKMVGWAGRVTNFVVFLGMSEVVEHLIQMPYNSWDLNNEIKQSESNLLRSFDQLNRDGGVISLAKTNVKKCGHFVQQWFPDRSHPRRLLVTPSGEEKCFDGTIIEDLDAYSDDQKSWRELIMGDTLTAYKNWVDQTSSLIKKYDDTYKIYQTFIKLVNRKSSYVFGDTNPFAGMKGKVTSQTADGKEEIKLIDDDRDFSIDEIIAAQKQNRIHQAHLFERLYNKISIPDEREKLKRIFAQQSTTSKTPVDKLVEDYTKNVEYLSKDLKSDDDKVALKAVEHLWNLSTLYNNYCISERDVQTREVTQQVIKENNLSFNQVLKNTRKSQGVSNQNQTQEKSDGEDPIGQIIDLATAVDSGKVIGKNAPSNERKLDFNQTLNKKRGELDSSQIDLVTFDLLSEFVDNEVSNQYLPLCVFKIAQHNLGNQKPGETKNSKKFMDELSLELLYTKNIIATVTHMAHRDADPDPSVAEAYDPFYPSTFNGVATPNVASYFLTAMMCGKDLKKKSNLWDKYGPDLYSDGSDRGWNFSLFGWDLFDRSSKTDKAANNVEYSSVFNLFGFKMDFLVPRLIYLNPRMATCEGQYKYINTIGSSVPVPLHFSEYIWIYEGKKYPSLVDLLAHNVYPEVLDSPDKINTGGDPTPSFNRWWHANIDPSFMSALDIVEKEYKKVITDNLLPALYGFRQYLSDVKAPDCSSNQADNLGGPTNMNFGNQTKGNAGGGGPTNFYYGKVLPPAAVTQENNNASSTDTKEKSKDRTVKNEPLYIYPAKHFTQEQVRACDGSQVYKYLPVINSARLEFNFYLEKLLKPMFLVMFTDNSTNQSEQTKINEKFFDDTRDWILSSIDTLLNFTPNENQETKTKFVPQALQWMTSNLVLLQTVMGLPVDPILYNFIKSNNNGVMEIDLISPNQTKLPGFNQSEWQTRNELLNELNRYVILNQLSEANNIPNIGSLSRILGSSLDSTHAPGWNQLTGDQKVLAQYVFAKMIAVITDLHNYKNIIDQLDFKNRNNNNVN